MAIIGPLGRIKVLKRVLSIPQNVFPHIHDQAVETAFVHNHVVQRVVELGIPLKDFVKPFPSQGIIRFPDYPLEHGHLPIGDPFADEP